MSTPPSVAATYYPNLDGESQSVQNAVRRAYDLIYALRSQNASIVQAHNQLAGTVASSQNQAQQTAAQVTALPSLDLLSSGVSTQLNTTQASILPAHNTGGTYVATSTTITFYWDGTNGSQQIQIVWPDGSTTLAPLANLAVTGLTPGATYYFYPSYNVQLNMIEFAPQGAPATCPNGDGTPPVAYPAANVYAAAAQDGDGCQALSNGPVVITLPSTGSASGSWGGK
jgi:hypothetical protein